MKLRVDRGFSLVEILFSIAILGILFSVAPRIFQRFFKAAVTTGIDNSYDGVPLQTARPWELYTTFPTVVAENLDKLKQWNARTTGPNTSGPYVLSPEERLQVLTSIRTAFPEVNLPSFPGVADYNESIYHPWGLLADEYGSAILAGGLVVADGRRPLFILRNDGSIVHMSKIDTTNPAHPSKTRFAPMFVPLKLWHWHLEDRQALIFLGDSYSNSDVAPPYNTKKLDLSTLAAYFNGDLVSGNFQFKNFQRAEMIGINHKEVVGELQLPILGTAKIDAYWRKDNFDHYYLRSKVGGRYVSELTFK